MIAAPFLNLRLSHPPLPRHAFVNQRLAVRREHGDLRFDARDDAFQFTEFFVEVSTDRFLFGAWGQRNGKLAAVTPLDADKFRSWLKGDKATNCGRGLAENSARSIVKNAQRIVGAAVKGQRIVENPFAGHSTAIIERPDRLPFVDQDTIRRDLAAVPHAEWRAVVSLCRFGGLRSMALTLSFTP